jgi:hypothetical protein
MIKKTKTTTKKRIRKLRLPDKPSSLILVALKDLRRVEKLKRIYRIEMGDWHRSNSHCSVCLAGAVMTRVCSPKEDVVPGDSRFSCDVTNKLLALNDFRAGYVAEGVMKVIKGSIYQYHLPYYWYIPSYKLWPETFYEKMNELAKMLKEKGL